jgi:hypothetical protein
MSNTLKLRDGYKTLTAMEQSDGTIYLSIHRPPGAWLEFSLTLDESRKLAMWLEACKANG